MSWQDVFACGMVLGLIVTMGWYFRSPSPKAQVPAPADPILNPDFGFNTNHMFVMGKRRMYVTRIEIINGLFSSSIQMGARYWDKGDLNPTTTLALGSQHTIAESISISQPISYVLSSISVLETESLKDSRPGLCVTSISLLWEDVLSVQRRADEERDRRELMRKNNRMLDDYTKEQGE